jgi:hypothetical protein
MSKGVQFALDAALAALAALEQDPDELRRLLNSATPPELAHAVAYLGDMYQDSLVARTGDSRELAIELFKTVGPRAQPTAT